MFVVRNVKERTGNVKPVFAKSVFNPLKTERFCVLKGISAHRAVNTLHLDHKTNLLVLHKAIFAVCSEIHIKHINSISSQYRIFECQTLCYVKFPLQG